MGRHLSAIARRIEAWVRLPSRLAGHPWAVRIHRARRKVLRYDEGLWKSYLTETREPKLHLGGGAHLLTGWLNTDLAPLPGVMIMDATAPYPFGAESFQYVFSEHMIEHVPYEQGVRMLRECHRSLRVGGVIRITTPDFAALSRLYEGPLTETQERYLAWFSEAFLPSTHPKSALAAINAHFRMWGHQFLYDEPTLSHALQTVGFKSVVRLRLGQSSHTPLRDLENTGRYPPGLLDYESMALEATK